MVCLGFDSSVGELLLLSSLLLVMLRTAPTMMIGTAMMANVRAVFHSRRRFASFSSYSRRCSRFVTLALSLVGLGHGR